MNLLLKGTRSVLFAVVSVTFLCFMQERGALGFERHYHVTDPFIRRLGLEAELQVSGQCSNSKHSHWLYSWMWKVQQAGVYGVLSYMGERCWLLSPLNGLLEPLGVQQLPLTVLSEGGSCQLFQVFSCKAEV